MKSENEIFRNSGSEIDHERSSSGSDIEQKGEIRAQNRTGGLGQGPEIIH